MLLVVIALGGYFIWTGSFFGEKLPAFTGLLASTFTPLAGISDGMDTPEILADSTPMAGLPAITDTPMTAERSPQQRPASRAVCGQKEPMILLALGIDEHEQADAIRIVRVDFTEHRILIFSIPRDLWVPIPNLSDHGITQFKINASYGYGEHFFGPGQGVVQFSQTIYHNFGINFDHYAVFHFSIFEDLVDAVGGVDLYLEQPIGAYNISGNKHFDGESALEYARLRLLDNDSYRINRQTEIIKSLFTKLIQPEYLIKVPGLAVKFLREKSLITDFSLGDVSTFICFAGQLNGDSLVFRDIPSNLYTGTTTNLGNSIKLPGAELIEFVQDLVINGNY